MITIDGQNVHAIWVASNKKQPGTYALVSDRHSSAHTLGWRFFYGAMRVKYHIASTDTVIGTVLAVGAPNATRDGRKVMCCIVITESLGLVRLYPLKWSDKVRQWAIIEAVITKSSKDSRLESFRVCGDVAVIGVVKQQQERNDILDDCLWSGDGDPIKSMNAEKASIVVVQSSGTVGTKLEPRDDTRCEDGEDDPWFIAQKSYPLKPYIVWKSKAGDMHETHVVAHEFYYGMQKNVEHPHRIFENAHIGDPDWCHWLVLGNMNNRRNVWVAAAIHRQKKTGSDTRINFGPDRGMFDGWPYCTEAAVRAMFVDLQRQLFTIDDT